MKKTLISAALALGFVGAAQAQMTLYGLIDMSYGKSLLGEVFLHEKADFHSGGDNGSSEGNSTTRVGIKGSSDLGGGIKGNFKFETGGIGSDGSVNGGGNFFNRQAWAGFSGGFGEVRLGRQDSVSFQTMIDFDFNGASNGVSAGGYSGVGVWLPGRQSRSLQYITPTLGGFTGQLGYVPKGNRGDNAKGVVSGGIKFAIGDLMLGGSFQSKADKRGEDFASLAASYDLKFLKVMVGYADGGDFDPVRAAAQLPTGSGDGPTVGLNVPIAGWNIGMHYSQNLDDDLKIKSAEVWVNKEIFKNTYAYVEAGNWKTSKSLNPYQPVAVGSTPAGRTKGTGYAAGVIWVF
jgi:predicted porin